MKLASLPSGYNGRHKTKGKCSEMLALPFLLNVTISHIG